ncbi:ATP-binding cassette domain-containing protein [Pseudokineococcus sp. 1T1Z-3]|uniref:ATP-binding cassette domain-containing protein n=1 Tax=Pseudokineococcus sp. 1T1Z-3 TaxID=3132745 RepID=UPI0030A1C536
MVLGRGRRARRAVSDLDLDLGVGVHGLLGPNGAGKTTLMRVLATVVPATHGQVRMLGLDVSEARERREVRRRLGYLPQTFGYYPRFTVEEFVTYFAWLKEVSGPGSGAAVARAIERVGLGDRAKDRMKTLSGGMLRRAGLAQALVNEPEVLLLDEPTAGLDPEQRLDFRALLRELGVDTTVVVSTHLVEDVASACTRVSVLDTGRLVRSCTREELANLADDHSEPDGSARPGHEHASPIELGYSALLRSHREHAAELEEPRG